MPSYFYKDIKGNTWKSSVKKTVLVTSQTYQLHSTLYWCFHWIKGALQGLRQFLITESPLKMMKNAYFTLKALFVLKIFMFLLWLFGHVEKTVQLER